MAIAGLLTAAAAPATTPDALVRTLYAAEQRALAGSAPPPWDPPERFFSRRLAALFRHDAARADREGVGRLQFDPLCNAQDCVIERLAIARRAGDLRRAIVDVRFRNMGAAMYLVFALVREPAGWRVDEVTATGADGWTLSDLLRGTRD